MWIFLPLYFSYLINMNLIAKLNQNGSIFFLTSPKPISSPVEIPISISIITYIQHKPYIIFGFQVHIAFHDFFFPWGWHMCVQAHACSGCVQVLLHDVPALGLWLEQHFLCLCRQITNGSLRAVPFGLGKSGLICSKVLKECHPPPLVGHQIVAVCYRRHSSHNDKKWYV